MEILLLEDIVGIGKKNDLLVVGDGFALNHLLPSRKALVATPTVRKRYAEQIRKRAEEKEGERALQMQAATALAGKSIQITHKAAKGGKLYAAVTEKNIVDALKDQHEFAIDPESIIISEHIKTTGVYQVQVKIGESSQNIQVIVKEEGAKKAAPKEAKAA